MTRDALVVGVNQYPFLKDTPTSKAKHLKTPASDAEAIAQLLESCGGNEVWSVRRLPEVYNPKPCIDQKGKVKQEELKTAISELFHPKTQYLPEVALLFFSGHGFRREHNAQTEGFLATSDVRLDRDKYGISLNWLREQMLTSPVKKQIVWLDSCHSGELLNFLTEAEFDNWLVGGDRLLLVAFDYDLIISMHPDSILKPKMHEQGA
ncbi:caspase family protein [Brasilonema sp. CT11]|nr:caspase family protein [Brasilonema sp. CT11]